MSALGESTVKAADVYRARYPSRRACRSRPYSADRMRELCSAGSGAGLAVPDPPLLRITLPGMYWSGGSASGGSEDCGVGPWGISTPGGFNPPGGGYVGSLGLSEPQTLIIRESHPSSKIRSRYWRGVENLELQPRDKGPRVMSSITRGAGTYWSFPAGKRYPRVPRRKEQCVPHQ